MTHPRATRDKKPGKHPKKKVGKVVDPARRCAFDALCAVEARDAYANLLLPKLLTQRELHGRDAAFVTEMVYGTLRQQGFLDAVLSEASSRPLKDVDLRTRTLLRIGVYQLLYMRVPAHAALSSTVGVARVALSDGPVRFVNAVLRRVTQADEQQWRERVVPDRDADPVGYLATAYSHPTWIVRAYKDLLPDTDEVEQLLRANNERAPVHVTHFGSAQERDAVVENNSQQLYAGEYSPHAIVLRGGNPGKLDVVMRGEAQVQDEGSQLATVALVEAQLSGRDEKWLDLCAGPGGKAALMGAYAQQRGASLTAVETVPHRAELVEKAVADTPTQVLCMDGRSVGSDERLFEDGYDRVLIDAPCTGLGALRRRPEARWRKQPGDIAALARMQRELLASGIRAARPGGIVAYVTCSPHIAETRVPIAEALRKHPVELCDVHQVLPQVPDEGQEQWMQLWPHRHGSDAMFIALLRVHEEE